MADLASKLSAPLALVKSDIDEKKFVGLLLISKILNSEFSKEANTSAPTNANPNEKSSEEKSEVKEESGEPPVDIASSIEEMNLKQKKIKPSEVFREPTGPNIEDSDSDTETNAINAAESKSLSKDVLESIYEACGFSFLLRLLTNTSGNIAGVSVSLGLNLLSTFCTSDSLIEKLKPLENVIREALMHSNEYNSMDLLKDGLKILACISSCKSPNNFQWTSYLETKLKIVKEVDIRILLLTNLDFCSVNTNILESLCVQVMNPRLIQHSLIWIRKQISIFGMFEIVENYIHSVIFSRVLANSDYSCILLPLFNLVHAITDIPYILKDEIFENILKFVAIELRSRLEYDVMTDIISPCSELIFNVLIVGIFQDVYQSALSYLKRSLIEKRGDSKMLQIILQIFFQIDTTLDSILTCENDEYTLDYESLDWLSKLSADGLELYLLNRLDQDQVMKFLNNSNYVYNLWDSLFIKCQNCLKNDHVAMGQLASTFQFLHQYLLFAAEPFVKYDLKERLDWLQFSDSLLNQGNTTICLGMIAFLWNLTAKKMIKVSWEKAAKFLCNDHEAFSRCPTLFLSCLNAWSTCIPLTDYKDLDMKTVQHDLLSTLKKNTSTMNINSNKKAIRDDEYEIDDYEEDEDYDDQELVDLVTIISNLLSS